MMQNIVNNNSYLFLFFSFTAVISSLFMITSKNMVKGVLYLMLTFLATAGVWLTVWAEFLALTLIVVYVGAVMVLFLFVVMMLNIPESVKQAKFVRFFPIEIVAAGGVFIGLIQMYQILSVPFLKPLKPFAQNLTSNIEALANVLYHDYLYPFEIAGVILLVAMIAAISLTFRGPQKRKSQSINEQVNTKKQDRLTMVSMEKKSCP